MTFTLKKPHSVNLFHLWCWIFGKFNVVTKTKKMLVFVFIHDKQRIRNLQHLNHHLNFQFKLSHILIITICYSYSDLASWCIWSFPWYEVPYLNLSEQRSHRAPWRHGRWLGRIQCTSNQRARNHRGQMYSQSQEEESKKRRVSYSTSIWDTVKLLHFCRH